MSRRHCGICLSFSDIKICMISILLFVMFPELAFWLLVLQSLAALCQQLRNCKWKYRCNFCGTSALRLGRAVVEMWWWLFVEDEVPSSWAEVPWASGGWSYSWCSSLPAKWTFTAQVQHWSRSWTELVSSCLLQGSNWEFYGFILFFLMLKPYKTLLAYFG